MGIDGYCFIIGLMIVPFSFLFFPKIYFNKRLTLPFFIVAAILATIGLLTFNNATGANPAFYLFLICPLYSLTLLKIHLFLFNKMLKRSPIDPPRNFFMNDDEFGWDRLFYFVFLMLSLTLPIAIFAHFYG